MLKHTLAVLSLFVPLISSHADPPVAVDEQFDITPVKKQLRLLTDGKNHFLLAQPFDRLKSPMLYSNDGKSFFQLQTYSGEQSGDGTAADDSYQRLFWDPRAQYPTQASFNFHRRKYDVVCQTRTTELKVVAAAAANKLLADAKFYKAHWKRAAYALARDNTGKYYYVDRANAPENNKDFRLYVGNKGSLALQNMTNVVSDSEGDIFATKSGSLRLILNKGESLWQAKNKNEKLLLLPIDVDVNRMLIYSDLGVYTGQRLGTPCDDL